MAHVYGDCNVLRCACSFLSDHTVLVLTDPPYGHMRAVHVILCNVLVVSHASLLCENLGIISTGCAYTVLCRAFANTLVENKGKLDAMGVKLVGIVKVRTSARPRYLH